jgi:hypothetical protein
MVDLLALIPVLLNSIIFLYYNVLNTCDMSRVLLIGTNNSHKNQKIRDEIHNLVDKAYYADPIKTDNVMAYLDNVVTE